MSSQTIPLFYWSEIKFIFKNKENYGDLLSKYLVEKISGKEVKWVHPKKQPWYKWNKENYLAIGSIIHHATKESIVWGSGIINGTQKVSNANFLAVRGPKTREYLLNQGYSCPEIYGDPALLMPIFYNPPVEKKNKLAIIPHYHDLIKAREIFANEPDILVIDLMTLNVEEVTSQIMSCETTISSSLHGLIVSHAYRIPSIWVEFSDKIFGDGIKYHDYLESVEMPYYQAVKIPQNIEMDEVKNLFIKYPGLPELGTVEKLCENLLKVSPFG